VSIFSDDGVSASVGRVLGLVVVFDGPYGPVIRAPGRTLGASGQQGTLGDDQIGRGKEGVHLRGVLLQTLVTHLAVTEEVFDDVKRVLDAGADLGLEVLGGLVSGDYRRTSASRPGPRDGGRLRF
jgi:hypothetical protein